MTTCRDTVERLLDYLEGGLTAEAQAALDAHLEGCPHCPEILRSYRATPRIVREATAVEIPEDVCRRLEAFLASRR